MFSTPRSRKPKPPQCRAVMTEMLVPPMQNGLLIGVPRKIKKRCKNAVTLDGLCTTHTKMPEMGRELELAQDE
ncbi:hypothetical protein MMMDOFMJ_3835 [Methylobacterium gnaphalii]|nr:hypothetical protein MMMDOFMJ_3835 [Methylobacterium gnaphalii]